MSRGWPRWTDEEISRVRELAKLGLCSTSIGPAIGRSKHAVSQKACQLGISLGRRRLLGSAPTDRSLWNDADRLSIWADVPNELAVFVVDAAKKFNIDLPTLRSESKAANLVSCRKYISVTARDCGYSYPVIGRALNRDHTTIIQAVKSNSSPQSTPPILSSSFVPCPREDKIAA